MMVAAAPVNIWNITRVGSRARLGAASESLIADSTSTIRRDERQAMEKERSVAGDSTTTMGPFLCLRPVTSQSKARKAAERTTAVMGARIGFWREVGGVRCGSRGRVCGFAAVLTLLSLPKSIALGTLSTIANAIIAIPCSSVYVGIMDRTKAKPMTTCSMVETP